MISQIILRQPPFHAFRRVRYQPAGVRERPGAVLFTVPGLLLSSDEELTVWKDARSSGGEELLQLYCKNICI